MKEQQRTDQPSIKGQISNITTLLRSLLEFIMSNLCYIELLHHISECNTLVLVQFLMLYYMLRNHL